MVEKKVSDDVILQTLKDFKALTEQELSEFLGYKPNTLNRRLKRMCVEEKIMFKRIPAIKTTTHYKIFDEYRGTRVYATNDEYFIKWILSHIPKRITPLYRRTFNYFVHQLGYEIELPKSNTKKQIWIYDLELYDIIKNMAKKQDCSISKVAQDLMRRGYTDVQDKMKGSCKNCKKYQTEKCPGHNNVSTT